MTEQKFKELRKEFRDTIDAINAEMVNGNNTPKMMELDARRIDIENKLGL